MRETKAQKPAETQSERWQFYLYVFGGWRRKLIGATWGLPLAVVGFYTAFRGEFGWPKLADVMAISTWLVVGAVWLVIAFIITSLVCLEGSYHYASRVTKKGTRDETRSDSEAKEPTILTPNGVSQHPASSLHILTERKAEDNVLDEKLLMTLGGIAKNSKRLVLPGDSTYASLEKRSPDIQQSICDADTEVLLICYSFTFWKDKIEEHMHRFLAKEATTFRVLMLMPDSSGFLEKSALEAFQYRGQVPTDFDAWLCSTEETRKAHRSDVLSSIDILSLWQQKHGKTKVDFRFYSDTPVLYGFACDREVFYVSSYFINPIERGFRLPSKVFRHKESGPSMIASVFLNWFDTKYATGARWPQVGQQK